MNPGAGWGAYASAICIDIVSGYTLQDLGSLWLLAFSSLPVFPHFPFAFFYLLLLCDIHQRDTKHAHSALCSTIIHLLSLCPNRLRGKTLFYVSIRKHNRRNSGHCDRDKKGLCILTKWAPSKGDVLNTFAPALFPC